jgi:5'-3' exonuclease
MVKTFKQLVERDKNRILIVDSLNLGFRWKHQGKQEFKEEYLRTVESFATSYNCGTIVITADLGSSKYRKKIYPEYKLDRKERYARQTQEEKDTFIRFYEEIRATLNLLSEKYIVLQYEGVEADDIAAYLVQNLKNATHVWLISSDRDWDLLINHNVSRFSYVNRKETTSETWKDTHNFKVEDYITVKCLTGDSGDNIPGIPGIGPKRAEILVQEYGSAFDIYDACPIESKYKYIQTLNEMPDILLRNYQLMDLIAYCEDAIGEDNILDIEKKCQSIFKG